MDRQDLLENVRNYTPKEIAKAIKDGVITLYDLKKYSNGKFSPLMQRRVQEILSSGEILDEPQTPPETAQDKSNEQAKKTEETPAPAPSPTPTPFPQPETDKAAEMSAGDGSETIGSSYDETHMGETPTWNIPDNVTGSQAEEVQPQPFTFGSDYPHYPQPPQNPPRSTPNLLSFNWGGFLLGWIWGISNHVYWSLSSLMLSIVFYLLIGIWIAEDFHGVNPGELAMLLTVTVLGKFVIRLILGISGNRMAWQSKKFTSIEEFERIQKGWNVASIIIYSIAIGVGIVLLSQA